MAFPSPGSFGSPGPVAWKNPPAPAGRRAWRPEESRLKPSLSIGARWRRLERRSEPPAALVGPIRHFEAARRGAVATVDAFRRNAQALPDVRGPPDRRGHAGSAAADGATTAIRLTTVAALPYDPSTRRLVTREVNGVTNIAKFLPPTSRTAIPSSRAPWSRSSSCPSPTRASARSSGTNCAAYYGLPA
jgi:hypothetical protein